MKIALLGYGDQGRSAYDYWGALGHEITICDAYPQLTVPDGVTKQLGEDYLKGLEQFDLLVRTPSLRPDDIVAANPETPDILNKVTTVTAEFMRVCPSHHIIGVTGTKGKGTTSTLIVKMLEAAGKKVHLGGNIGTPPLDMLKGDIKKSHWVVLELANFQLIDLPMSPPIAVCLMIVPEHLNWHPDMEDYVAAKKNLFKYQKPTDRAVFHRLNEPSREAASVSPAQKIGYEVPKHGIPPQTKTGAYVENEVIYMDGTEIGKVEEIKLRGRHNVENVCAAIAAVWDAIDQNVEAVRKVITTFSGLPHRLELVRQFNDVSYYDDSFGTTPETALVAVQAFTEPKIIILGGSDKGANYEELAQVIATNNVRAAVIIGETGPTIEAVLKNAGFTNTVPGGTTMHDIVGVAHAQAQPGDVVLLSTGCASFDLFKNYKDRGEQFQVAVNSL